MRKFVILLGCIVVIKGLFSERSSKTTITFQNAKDSLAVFTLIQKSLERNEIEFPRVVTAQIMLETGWLTSQVYRENHNLFGMKFRPNRLATGELNNHAAYSSNKRSLLAYRKYQKMILRLARKKHPVVTEQDYFDVLNNLPHCTNCRYAEDTLYTVKLQRIINIVETAGGNVSNLSF